MDGLHDYFRLTGDAARLGALVPGLSLDGRGFDEDVTESQGPDHEELARSGIAAFPILTKAEASRLETAIAHLRAAERPATLVYAFDEPWQLGARVARAVSRALSAEYVLLDDAWAFAIDPGAHGWPAHRGMSHELFDRARPEVLDTWVAITDAPVERSCLHAVPLDEDPGYPDQLSSVAVPDARARALPVTRGTALAWNANVLHWGGPCTANAAGPRMSLTYTLVRRDAAARLDLEGRVVAPLGLDFDARIALVAAQLRTYGEGQHDVSEDALNWAQALGNLTARARRSP